MNAAGGARIVTSIMDSKSQFGLHTAGQGMNVPHDGYFYVALPERIE